MSRPQAIYRAQNLHQAHMLKNVLESYGIRSHVIDNDTASLRENIEQTPDVVVAEEDAEIATGIAEIFHNHLKTGDGSLAIQGDQGLSLANEETEEGEDFEADAAWSVWPSWPECPRCKVRRQTSCPVCHDAGNHYPLAYVPPGLETQDLAESLISTGFTRPQTEQTQQDAYDTNVLLMCTTCDEPFLPHFYRQCEHCGHEFSSGLPTLELVTYPKISGALFFGCVMLMLYAMGVWYLIVR